MLKERDTVIRRAMIAFDGFIVAITFVLAHLLRQHFHVFYKFDLIPSVQVVSPGAASISDYLVVVFFVVPLWCAMLYLNGMYSSIRTKTLLRVIWIIIKSAFLTTILFGTAVFLFKLHFVSRALFGLFIITSSAAILLEKITIFSIMHYT